MFKNLVVFLHGLGSDGNDMKELWRTFASRNPAIDSSTLFISPDAPIMTIKYFGGQQMRSWFDLYGLDTASPDDWPGMENSRKVIEDLIDQTILQHKTITNVIIGGFSQGGALTYSLALQTSRPELKAAVVLSGWLPGRQTPLLQKITDLGRNLPIFHAHGTSKLQPCSFTVQWIKWFLLRSSFKTHSNRLISNT